MGGIGPAVKENLLRHGVDAEYVEFKETFKDEFGYRRTLFKAAERLRPDLILPVGNPLFPAKLRGELAERFPDISILSETEEKTALLESKVRFYRYAESLGILQPGVFGNPEEIPEGIGIIFKRDFSYSGHGVHRPTSAAALRNLIDHQSPGEPYLIEELIEGTVFSVDVVRLGGIAEASSYRTDSSRGFCGPAIKRTAERHPGIERIAVGIMESLDFNGICGFDFIVTADGLPYLLEANPRFTGGISTQIEAGFEIPFKIWLYLQKNGKL